MSDELKAAEPGTKCAKRVGESWTVRECGAAAVCVSTTRGHANHFCKKHAPGAWSPVIETRHRVASIYGGTMKLFTVEVIKRTPKQVVLRSSSEGVTGYRSHIAADEFDRDYSLTKTEAIEAAIRRAGAASAAARENVTAAEAVEAELISMLAATPDDEARE